MNICIIQARASSSRFPNKVLAPLQNKTVIQWVVDACRHIRQVDKVVVATSDHQSDDTLASHCEDHDIPVFRGSLDNVLERFVQCAKAFDAKNILRITGDCPFLDPQVASEVLGTLTFNGLDYVNNTAPATYPDGLDCEALTFSCLMEIEKNASRSSHKEHVTSYINENRSNFKTRHVTCPVGDYSGERWTLDYPEDLEFLDQIAKHLAKEPTSYLDILSILQKNNIQHPLTGKAVRNEGYVDDQSQDNEYLSFENSKAFLKKAEALIPVGAQTFSKSKYMYSPGYAPLFLSHGDKSNVWDIDGNKYVDLVSALRPVILGYCDYDVDRAIQDQLGKGISFSLSTELEYRLAKKMNQLIPSAEMVRFGKNGTDATSACVRLARAHTNRDRVMVCGYHGWQDWYIGSTTRSKGVPKDVQKMTSTVPYNDLEAVEKLLEAHKGEFACLIMEPMNVVEPKEGYFADLHKLLKRHETLLVFDEIITGFCFHLGGAQSLFGVTPDLACFGKAMANGMPISAVVGRKDVMNEMEHIFYSGTFGGEALSMAASMAVIEKMEREPVIETIWSSGKKLKDIALSAAKTHKVDDIFSTLGIDPWILWNIAPREGVDPLAIKSFLLYELHNSGILTLGSHNICYALSDADCHQVEKGYHRAFKKLNAALEAGDFEKNMKCPKITPIFKVR